MTTLRAVVLVEGNSDRVALHTLAERRHRDLAAEGIEVVAMDGITNTRAFASRYGPHGLGVPLAGLYDAAEEAKLRHGLAAAGLVAALEPDGPSRLGFYKCSADLEDELIRALGAEAVEAVIEAAGEAHSLRLLAGMPAQRDWTREAVLRRFLGVRSGRKARYAALLVEALEPGRVPQPLAAVLARVRGDRTALRRRVTSGARGNMLGTGPSTEAVRQVIGPVQQRRPGSLETPDLLLSGGTSDHAAGRARPGDGSRIGACRRVDPEQPGFHLE